MNERIRELLKQAGGEFWQRLENDAVNPEAYITFDPPESLAKFAELIVKECIRVPYAMWDQAELNADIAVKIEHRIKEHFGMEQ